MSWSASRRERGIETAAEVYRPPTPGVRLDRLFEGLFIRARRDVGILSFFLRVHLDIFARGQAKLRPQARESRDQDIAAAAMRRSDANEAGRPTGDPRSPQAPPRAANRFVQRGSKLPGPAEAFGGTSAAERPVRRQYSRWAT